MIWFAAILSVYSTEFVVGYVSWQAALGSQYLIAALFSQLLINLSKEKTVLFRSIAMIFCLSSWSDFACYVIWQYSDTKVDLSIPIAIVFFSWLIYVLKRKYAFKSDKVSNENIGFLFLHPRTNLELIKTFLGIPVSSMCIVTDGFVWSFRSKTGKFEKIRYSDSWLEQHIYFDTNIPCSSRIIEELNMVIGESRYPYCKCVYSVRNVLKEMGGKFSIKTWFDYLPGIYAIRIWGNENNRNDNG